jgi:hypothetical protein
MNKGLEQDLTDFLNLYHLFTTIENKCSDKVLIEGTVNVVNLNGEFLESYEVVIIFSKKNYPHTIPNVVEKSCKIIRHWDNHISPQGECCLSIPHALLKMENKGIVLKDFYSEVIYPFFANYHYKKLSGRYANGEYEHFDEGIIQYYREVFSLTDPIHIGKIIEAALGNYEYPSYLLCPICGIRKYKKCCRKIIYQLRLYGKQRLQEDLKIFLKISQKIPPTENVRGI